MDEKITYYELSASQNVVKLQCKFSLFKRVINILSGISTADTIDRGVMLKAFNLMLSRNDCMRIRYVKKDGKLLQYFLDKVEVKDIPYFEFKSEEEQNAFIDKIKKKPTKYLKGEVFNVYFVKTFDDKFMVVLKVCHLILDLYGINVIYNDLFGIYNALKNGTELPPEPYQFEPILKSELTRREDKEKHDKEAKFFIDYLSARERPSYAGVHGKELPRWQKLVKKGKSAMNLFFIRNDTLGTTERIEKPEVEKLIEYSKANKYTIANVLFYLTSLTASKLNDVNNMLPLELCNCRGTLAERKTAGIKVQTVGCYTKVDPEKSFAENMADFAATQTEMYRHIGFEDVEFQSILNKVYSKPLFQTFFSVAFSFVPFVCPENTEIMVFSNGKGALPCYFCYMFDSKSNTITCGYDYQKLIITKKDITRFNDTLIKLLNQALDNPDKKIKDLHI